jgi:hypothetical protein
MTEASGQETKRKQERGGGRDGRARAHPPQSGDARRGASRGKDAADAGREPTPDEEEAAERNEPDEEVAEHYEEMTERGAKQRGEGRVP